MGTVYLARDPGRPGRRGQGAARRAARRGGPPPLPPRARGPAAGPRPAPGRGPRRRRAGRHALDRHALRPRPAAGRGRGDRRAARRGRRWSAVALGVAQALLALHAAGVVHRDLTPGNVLLVDGEPHVIDLGLAAVADVTALTRSGLVLGTAGYLAPEQVVGRGRRAGRRRARLGGDAGAGRHRPAAVRHRPAEAVLYRVVHAEPDLAGLPDALAGLVAAALAKEPAARPGLPTSSRRAGWPPRATWSASPPGRTPGLGAARPAGDRGAGPREGAPVDAGRRPEVLARDGPPTTRRCCGAGGPAGPDRGAGAGGHRGAAGGTDTEVLRAPRTGPQAAAGRGAAVLGRDLSAPRSAPTCRDRARHRRAAAVAAAGCDRPAARPGARPPRRAVELPSPARAGATGRAGGHPAGPRAARGSPRCSPRCWPWSGLLGVPGPAGRRADEGRSASSGERARTAPPGRLVAVIGLPVRLVDAALDLVLSVPVLLAGAALPAYVVLALTLQRGPALGAAVGTVLAGAGCC